MQTLIDIAVLALFAFFIVDAVRNFMASHGSLWQRLLAIGKSSATIVWTRFVALVAAALDLMIWLADALNAPQVAQVLQTYGNPKAMAQLIIAITVVAELARRRTLQHA